MLALKTDKADGINFYAAIDFAPTGGADETERSHGVLPTMTVRCCRQTIAQVGWGASSYKSARTNFLVRNRTKLTPLRWNKPGNTAALGLNWKRTNYRSIASMRACASTSASVHAGWITRKTALRRMGKSGVLG